MGDTSGAKIAMLDINKDNISVDVQRDTGFLVGFGIEVPDLTVMGSETDPRVIGHESSDANPEGGLRAMETLLAKDPDINVIYTINEPAAEGAFQAMKNAGKEARRSSFRLTAAARALPRSSRASSVRPRSSTR
jgi:fructose transport system substrate-binding protein